MNSIKKTITVSPKQIRKFISQSYGEDIEVEGFEGWTMDEVDTSTGDYDSEKGAMTDYEMVLTSPEGLEYEAYDGYYTGVTGHQFHDNVLFSLRTPKVFFAEWLNALPAQELTPELKQTIIAKHNEL
jgi:hypothetical protein